ncbi:MAG TPA: hypothetical protein ENK88_07675 [Campylobacterales bacterium]|nr:hypothetical protein [Campylobacterales bacterium]
MRRRLITGFLLIGFLSMPLISDSKKDKMTISAKEREDIISDGAFVMPSAGALANSLKIIFHNIDWNQFIKPNIKYIGKTNEEKVLNLGIKGADLFFLSISQNVNNLTTVAKNTNLILNEIIINRKSINSVSRKKSLKNLQKLIKKEKWGLVLKEITTLKENINMDFEDMQKHHLALLNDIGSWMEGYRLTVEALKLNYKKSETAILIQTPLINYLLKEIKNSKELEKFSKRDKIIDLLENIDTILNQSKNYQLSKQDIDKLSNFFTNKDIL